MVRSGGSLRPDELPKRQKALRQISVSECEFSKAVDKVYLIRTGTALGDIHVAGRLSQTSCLLHPDDSPLLKKISTRSDRYLPEDLLPLREFVWFANIYSPFSEKCFWYYLAQTILLFIHFKKLMQFELLICLDIIKISFADWIEIEFRFKT